MNLLPAVSRWTSDDGLRRNSALSCQLLRQSSIAGSSAAIENKEHFVTWIILREERAKIFGQTRARVPCPARSPKQTAGNQEAAGSSRGARKPRNEIRSITIEDQTSRKRPQGSSRDTRSWSYPSTSRWQSKSRVILITRLRKDPDHNHADHTKRPAPLATQVRAPAVCYRRCDRRDTSP